MHKLQWPSRRIAFGLLLGFLVLLALALLGDLRQVSERVWTFRWSLYPLVILLSLTNYILRFVKWHFYVQRVGVDDFPLSLSARLFFSSFPLSITPGKIGEVLKGIWLNQLNGMPVGRGISVVMAERISDGLAVMMLAIIGVVAYPRYWPAFAALLALLLLVVLITQVRPLGTAILRVVRRLPIIRRFTHLLDEFYEGSYLLFRPSTTLIATSLGILSWVWEGVGFYLILIGLGISPGWQVLSIAIFVLAFSTIVGAVSTLPAGLGVAEVSIAGMLILLLGLKADIAATATLLIRFATLWFSVGLGLVVWFFSRHLLGIEQILQPHDDHID